MRLSPCVAAALAIAGCGTDVMPLTSTTYTRLIGRTWTVEPATYNVYKCVRYTIRHDMYITGFEAQAPTGTHHTVLTIAGANDTAGPDGEYDCKSTTMGLQLIYASSVGTSPMDLPEGVGFKLRAGQQIHFQIHLANASDATLTGDTAILVKSQDTPPPLLAEMALAGKFNFTIPPMAAAYDVVGGCTADKDFSVFSVWPHMHQLGQHQKLELVRDGAVQTVLDQPFAFGEQNYYMQNPVVDVKAGDQIRVTCSYLNTTGGPVTFGDGQFSEMCFSGLYRYPVLDEGVFRCTDNPD
jgi:hypothetical protein